MLDPEAPAEDPPLIEAEEEEDPELEELENDVEELDDAEIKPAVLDTHPLPFQ